MFNVDLDVTDDLKLSLKIMRLLKDKFGCNRPAFALYQIKRQIRAGKKITTKQIKEWGK